MPQLRSGDRCPNRAVATAGAVPRLRQQAARIAPTAPAVRARRRACSGHEALVVLLAARRLGLVSTAEAQEVNIAAQAQQARHEAAQLGGVAVCEEEGAAQGVLRAGACGVGVEWGGGGWGGVGGGGGGGGVTQG